MAEFLTIRKLKATTQTTVTLPVLSARIGTEQRLTVRWLSYQEFLSCLPPSPPGSIEWPAEAYADMEQAWLAGLPAEKLDERRGQMADFPARVTAKAAVAPALVLEDARALADDAIIVCDAVIAFSKTFWEVVRKTAEVAAGNGSPEDAASRAAP